MRRRSWGYGAIRALRKRAVALALALGMATGASGALAGQVTVAALGDSLTQGYGLVTEDGFVPQLESWLNARGADVRVINAGVSGDTTQGGLSRVGWTLTPEVDAMIVALGGNDLLRGLDPALSRANLDGILAAAGDAGVPVLLVGLAAPGNYGQEYKRAFDGMYRDLAEAHGALYAQSFLGPLMDAAEAGAAMGTLMQPDGIHPSAQGVSLIVEGLGPMVLDLVARAGPGG